MATGYQAAFRGPSAAKPELSAYDAKHASADKLGGCAGAAEPNPAKELALQQVAMLRAGSLQAAEAAHPRKGSSESCVPESKPVILPCSAYGSQIQNALLIMQVD